MILDNVNNESKSNMINLLVEIFTVSYIKHILILKYIVKGELFI